MGDKELTNLSGPEYETAATSATNREHENDLSEPALFLRPGTLLNQRYRVDRLLGYGGFGITYLAWDLNLQIKVAVKEYLPQSLATRAPGNTSVTVYTGKEKDYFLYGVDKFIEEARALAKFNGHPSVVSVSDFFRENETAYLVMEYVDGITFKNYLARKGGKISYEEAFGIMKPVMEALSEVHKAGMLHRDISPDNIYITKNDHVKLLDFGAARYAVGEKSQKLSVLFKPGYTPWEQYQTNGEQGAWTDVYAAAATMYWAITGEIPQEALERMDNDRLQPPSKMGITIPAEFEKVLLKALSVKAKERFQTINELQTAFLNSLDKRDRIAEKVYKSKREAHLLKIIPVSYLHPEDKAALDNLTAIPLFPTCVKAFMKVVTEKMLYGMNMAQKIRLGPNQLPEIHKYLSPVCETLGIQEPEMYLEMNPLPNAYTFGDTQVFLTVTSGLIEHLEEEEIKTVIAHECGHIACRHMLYHTMATMILLYGVKIFGTLAAVAMPVWLALLYWQRRSELSADRAAAVVMNGASPVVDTMIRLAGGPKSITGNVNVAEYIKQADVYDRLLEESQWQMLLQGIAVMEQNHPFLAVRTREILKWCDTEQFQRILQARKEGTGRSICQSCGCILQENWVYCRQCGNKIIQ